MKEEVGLETSANLASFPQFSSVIGWVLISAIKQPESWCRRQRCGRLSARVFAPVRQAHRNRDPPSTALNVSRLGQIFGILEWPVFQQSSTALNPMVYVSCKHLGRAVSRVLSMRSKRSTSCRLLARRTSELLEENDIESMTSGDALPVRSFSSISAESRAMQEHYRAKEDQWPTDP